METMHKRVASVTPVPLGDETTTAQVTTDTVILVANSGDFYEDGGYVRIDGEVYTYSAVEEGEDDDAPAPSITLDTGLVADVDAGTPVEVWDPNAVTGSQEGDGDVVSDWMVEVTDDTDGSPGIAYLDHALIPLLAEGMTAGVGASVTVTVDDLGDWNVTNIHGKTPSVTGSFVSSVNDYILDDTDVFDAAVAASLARSEYNASILSQRFEIPSIFISATKFRASGQGTPTDTPPLGNIVPCWRLDGAGATDEGVVTSIELPRAWATFDVYARGVNAGAGTGAVRLIGQWNNSAGDGDDVTAGSSTGTAGVLTAGLLNIRQEVRLRTNLAHDPNCPHVFRIYRTPSHASDTLANDWALTGIKLVATSWVEFAPEAPEEPEDLTGRTFTQSMNAELGGLRVWHQTTPPADNDDDEVFKSFPATDYATRLDYTASTWVGNKWSIVWDNRCNYGDAHSKSPNPLVSPAVTTGGKTCRAVYTTRELAMAATKTQVRHALGMVSGDYEDPWTAAGGSAGDIIDDATWRADPATYCATDFIYGGTTYAVMVDKVPLLPAPMTAADPEHLGVFLDYEPHDSRSDAETVAHVDSIAADVHGESKELFFYTNPLNGDIQPYSGISPTSLPDILDDVDHLAVLLWSGSNEGVISDSWDAQIAALGTVTTAEWAKIAITFELGTNPGTTLADAEWVYAKLTEGGTDHPTKLVFWRNGAQLGGAPERVTNQKISMACFGSAAAP